MDLLELKPRMYMLNVISSSFCVKECSPPVRKVLKTTGKHGIIAVDNINSNICFCMSAWVLSDLLMPFPAEKGQLQLNSTYET